MVTTHALIRYFESLTPETVERVGEYYDEDATFSDPFNEVRGSRAIAAIYGHMFEQLGEPRFRVSEYFERRYQLMLVWRFHCLVGDRSVTIEGASHLRLGADGRITEHRDYWDAAGGIYEHLPGIGVLMRYARRKLATSKALLQRQNTGRH